MISRSGAYAAYLVPAALVGGAVLLLVGLQGRAEAAAAAVAGALPLGYAYAAGVVASVNPCGFILLPSYISFQLGAEEPPYYETPPALRALRALLLGAVATCGFVLVFAAAGAVIAAGGQWLGGLFGYAGALVGIAMALLGVYLLVSRRSITLAAATRLSVSPRRGLAGAFVFGLAYAIGSLGCSLPVFLVVAGGALSAADFGGGLAQFVSYSLGMGTVLVAVTLGVALFKGAVSKTLRGLMPHLHRVSAFFLIGAGAYLVWYWGIYSAA